MTPPEQDSAGTPISEQTERLMGDVGERVGRTVGWLARGLGRVSNGAFKDSERPATERAEELVTGVEQSVAGLAATATYSARRMAARAREEMEDIRAEADSLRSTPAEEGGA